MNAPASLRSPILLLERAYWTPAPLFRGETVFVAASGPSFTKEVADRLPADRTIVVNSSCRLKPDAAVLFFTDSGWYAARKEIVETWPGLVVTMSRQAKRELDDPALSREAPRVMLIKGCGSPSEPPRWRGRPGFPPAGHAEVQQGRNSGNTAAALAIATGAAKVGLIGFDCRVVGGREHFHDEYKGPRDLGLYDGEFLHAFDGWNEAALASGVKIMNCTPGSAITEFPAVDLDEALSCNPS